MSKDNRCVICKHKGIQNSSNLDTNRIYGPSGQPVQVLLCRSHAVELFQMGQKNFFIHHHKILFNIINSDEVEFLVILHDTVKEHIDSVY